MSSLLLTRNDMICTMKNVNWQPSTVDINVRNYIQKFMQVKIYVYVLGFYVLVEMNWRRKGNRETDNEERKKEDRKASGHSFVIYSVIFNFGDQLI